jgi:hypothetical protein
MNEPKFKSSQESQLENTRSKGCRRLAEVSGAQRSLAGWRNHEKQPRRRRLPIFVAERHDTKGNKQLCRIEHIR